MEEVVEVDVGAEVEVAAARQPCSAAVASVLSAWQVVEGDGIGGAVVRLCRVYASVESEYPRDLQPAG